jgi:nicotinate-nucleotide pyrophosphorylase (carboxylating)
VTNHDLIVDAFLEDLPGGDVTTDPLQNQDLKGYAFLIAKADIKLSGQEIFTQSVLHVAPASQIKWHFKDGDTVLKNQKICTIHGPLLPVLKAERVALNFLGFLSGIATLTQMYVNACAQNTSLRILDTRKTIPGYRDLIKKAVRDGGGTNHRMNLSDAVLIKENHVRVAGGISKAVEQIRTANNLPITVEVTNIAEVREAVSLNVQRLLLDNMDDATLQEAVALVPDEIETEASGNMNLDRVRRLSQISGLDFISVGAITHSAPTADVSLLFDF